MPPLEKNLALKVSDYLQQLRNSKLRYVVWPIKSTELIKFIPMSLLMFMILLNQNIIRGIKDSLLITNVGPESVSFIKLWCDLPAGFLFIIVYAKLCNIMSTENVFRTIVISFLLFFFCFAFFIFPNQESFHPDPYTVEYYLSAFPRFKWFIMIWSKWSIVLFYVIGELWPIVVFSLLYWQLANKITKTEEAARFYSFFSFFGQSNLLLSGKLLSHFSQSNHCMTSWFDNIVSSTTQVMLQSLIIIVVGLGFIILAIHRFIERNVICNLHSSAISCSNENTLKMSLRESARTILSSKYLGLICLMIISYSVSINLLEGLWMYKTRELYPTSEQFIAYQGNVLYWTGLVTITCAFLGSSIIRSFGWYWGAIITPVTVFIAGSLFFFSCAAQEYLDTIMLGTIAASPLFIIVFIGAMQNVLGKGVKYSLFDATKEMTYIPLDSEIKTKGKAAVEVAGMKVGKSLGAILQCSIFFIYPAKSYNDIILFLLIAFILVCITWIYGVKALSISYYKLLKANGPTNDSSDNIEVKKEEKEMKVYIKEASKAP